MLAARAVKAAADRNVRRFTAALRTDMAAVRRTAADWGEVEPAEGSGHGGRPRLDGAFKVAGWWRNPEEWLSDFGERVPHRIPTMRTRP
jgi:hypothetical protein